MEDITYCYEWNNLLRVPRQPYDEKSARRRHERGQLYSVVFGDPNAPRAEVQVRLETQWCSFHLFDARLFEQAQSWSFGIPDGDNRLFLEEYHRFFFDHRGAKRYSELAYIRPDGLIKVREADLLANEVYTYDIRGDVSTLWTAMPSFGDYTSITRFEGSDPFESLPREAPWSKVWAGGSKES